MSAPKEPRRDLLIAAGYLEDWQRIPHASEGWKQEVNRDKELIVRVKVIRLANGDRLRFYATVPKPATQSELRDMLKRIRAIRKAKDALIVASERRLIKNPRRRKR